ncbi:1715_t:CDS:2, partial [Racocetra fulgida]
MTCRQECENLDAALENNLNSNAHIEHHQQSRSPSVELQSQQICNENQQDQNKASQIHDSLNHNNKPYSAAMLNMQGSSHSTALLNMHNAKYNNPYSAIHS